MSADVTWARAPFEVTVTLFHSRIDGALAAHETGHADFPIAIVNVDGSDRSSGTEFIARRHVEGFDFILTHMYLWSTEPLRWHGPSGNAAQSTALGDVRPAAANRPGARRLRGVLHRSAVARREPVSYPRASACTLRRAGDLAVGTSRVFLNVENLGDVRQTREHPLVRAGREPWTAGGPWMPGRLSRAGRSTRECGYDFERLEVNVPQRINAVGVLLLVVGMVTPGSAAAQVKTTAGLVQARPPPTARFGSSRAFRSPRRRSASCAGRRRARPRHGRASARRRLRAAMPAGTDLRRHRLQANRARTASTLNIWTPARPPAIGCR